MYSLFSDSSASIILSDSVCIIPIDISLVIITVVEIDVPQITVDSLVKSVYT